VTGSAGLATGGALAWGKIWGTKLLLTVSVASVLLGVPAGYFILRQGATPLASVAPPTAETMPPVQQVPAIAPAPPIAMPVLAPPAGPTHTPLARVSSRAVTTSADLRAELKALDAVRSTLVGGDFFRSLSLLDSYFQKFRHGRLHLEAEVLRIDALARCGQPEAARSYAKEFLRRNPNSVHTARLQSIVGP
jgi:hypothetical protein